jgi:hypothetical protein
MFGFDSYGQPGRSNETIPHGWLAQRLHRVHQDVAAFG